MRVCSYIIYNIYSDPKKFTFSFSDGPSFTVTYIPVIERIFEFGVVTDWVLEIAFSGLVTYMESAEKLV